MKFKKLLLKAMRSCVLILNLSFWTWVVALMKSKVNFIMRIIITVQRESPIVEFVSLTFPKASSFSRTYSAFLAQIE